MRALVLHDLKSKPRLEDRPPLRPGADEAVVSLKAAALNRRDYWITQGLYPAIKLPIVLGSDGAGIVTSVGKSLGNYWLGREVIINPGIDWGKNQHVQADEFSILGLPRDGTFATEVAVPVCQLHERPQHLSWHESAALPLAGLAAWRVLFTQGGLKAGQSVLITGIGGGVATIALQFAVAAGANVWVTSSSETKIAQAVRLGAKGGTKYTDEGWAKTVVNDFRPPQLIIDSAAGGNYRHLIDLAAPGGRLVNYGATAGPPEKLDMFKVFWKQLHLQGSTMGSPEDFAAMLKFAREHQLAPPVDSVLPLQQAAEALHRMETSAQFGKLVLSIDAST